MPICARTLCGCTIETIHSHGTMTVRSYYKPFNQGRGCLECSNIRVHRTKKISIPKLSTSVFWSRRPPKYNRPYLKIRLCYSRPDDVAASQFHLRRPVVDICSCLREEFGLYDLQEGANNKIAAESMVIAAPQLREGCKEEIAA